MKPLNKSLRQLRDGNYLLYSSNHLIKHIYIINVYGDTFRVVRSIHVLLTPSAAYNSCDPTRTVTQDGYMNRTFDRMSSAGGQTGDMFELTDEEYLMEVVEEI